MALRGTTDQLFSGGGASPAGAGSGAGFMGTIDDLFGSAGALKMAGLPIPSLTGGRGGDGGPSYSQGGEVGGAMFDNSGWNVTFGNGSGIEASRSQVGALAQYLPYLLAGGALLLGLKWIKVKHHAN